jgi:hypothetical protein
MGDTFPFDKRNQASGLGFNCFDLRVKHYYGASSLAALVQELGRMCRYSTGQWTPYAMISSRLFQSITGTANSAEQKIFSKTDFHCQRVDV